MVYVVTLKRVMPKISLVEVFEDRRNALERLAVWHGCPEHLAILATDEELENQIRDLASMGYMFEAEFYPKMPLLEKE
jgi:hypothetical protein